MKMQAQEFRQATPNDSPEMQGMQFSSFGGANPATMHPQPGHTNITNVNNNINFYGPVVNHVYTTSAVPTGSPTIPMGLASPILTQ